MKMIKNQKYIIRTIHAGVFYAEVDNLEHHGDSASAELIDARRIYYWDGAATLSQLATDGVARPERCKFTITVKVMEVMGIIELIPCTDKACKSIDSVEIWRQ